MADLLLVDNDTRITELLAFFLKMRGHAVRTVPSFVAARAAIRTTRPDLMLADLELGSTRGEEELPNLAREGLLPPTLVVSGYLDAQSEAGLARIAAVVGVLRKPFDLTQLEERIAEALAVGRVAPAGTGGTGGDWVDVQPWEEA
jgi:DNA-binding response OmpR family regulator